MKKLFAIVLCLVMVLSLVACGENDTPETTTTEPTTEAVVPAPDALEVITNLVNSYNTTHAGTDYQLPVAGGGYENRTDAPEVVSLDEVDCLTGELLVPEAELSNLTAAASALHTIRINNFCAVAYNLAEGTDKAAFATAMRDAFKNHQWTSGPCDHLLVAEVNGCVVAVYGLTDVLNYFAAEITATYPEATILFNEPIAS